VPEEYRSKCALKLFFIYFKYQDFIAEIKKDERLNFLFF